MNLAEAAQSLEHSVFLPTGPGWYAANEAKSQSLDFASLRLTRL